MKVVPKHFVKYVLNAPKAAKVDAQNLVLEIAGETDPDDGERLEALAELYQYFRPSTASFREAANNPLKWVQLAVAANDVRPYLNHLYVTANGQVVATDGHRLHLLNPAEPSLAPGWYERNSLKKVFELTEGVEALGAFPEFSQVMHNAGRDSAFSASLDDLESHPVMRLNQEYFEVVFPNGSKGMFNAAFWKAAICRMSGDSVVRYRGNGTVHAGVQIERPDGTEIAVVMPCRL